MIKVKRGNYYTDRLRSYKVFIDGIYQGDIKNNEVKEFQVNNGNHSICVKIDWCRSNLLDFHVDGTKVEFEVGSSLVGWKSFFTLVYITFLRKKYLWIKQTD